MEYPSEIEEHIEKLKQLGVVVVKVKRWDTPEAKQLVSVTRRWLKGYGEKAEPRHIRLFISLVECRVAQGEPLEQVFNELAYDMKRFQGNFKKVLEHWVLKMLNL